MGYTEQFKAFREARGLTREALAAHAGCHRNTVLNVESGRPVKFSTVVLLMQSMGYSPDSAETKQLAVLWLEAVTGVHLSVGEARAATRDRAGTLRRLGAVAQQLQSEVARHRLSRDDIELLAFAARHRKVLNALRAIRELLQEHEHRAPSLLG